MFYLIVTLVVGINFAPFIFSGMDMWTAQGLWVQICTVSIFSYMLFEKKRNTASNLSLSLMFGWLSFVTFFRIYKSYNAELHLKMQRFFVQQEFAAANIHHYIQLFKITQNVIYTLAPYLNFLCLLIIYLAVTEYLSRREIEKLLTAMKYTVIVTLLTCVLQKFGISQFFEIVQISEEFNKHHNNLVTGFLSNGTHLSGFLASCAPLFLWKLKRADILSLILLPIVLWFSSTTINDPAVSGYIILILVCLFFYKHKKSTIAVIFLLVPGLAAAIKFLPKSFWAFNGRIQGFTRYWPVYLLSPMTGHGLGTVNILSREMIKLNIPLVGEEAAGNYARRHLHLEYFQFMIEIGTVGLLLILNMVNEFFHTKAEDRTELVLKAMVLGFLLSCLFNYPAHLWLPSSWAMAAYASFAALKGDNYGIQKRIKRRGIRYDQAK